MDGEHSFFEITALQAFGDAQVARLAEAAVRGDLETVKALTAQGVDVNAQSTARGWQLDEPISVLEWAWYEETEIKEEILLALLDAGAVPAVLQSYGKGDAMDENYSDMVMEADCKRLKALLDAGISPDLRDPRRELTLLCHAIEEDWEERFNVLMAYKADPNLADKWGERDTPLHYAVRTWWHRGDKGLKYLLPLLEAGADPRATNTVGKTFQYYLVEIDERRYKVSPAFVENKHKVQNWLIEHGIALETDNERSEEASENLARPDSDEVSSIAQIMDKLNQSVAQLVAMEQGDGEVVGKHYYTHRNGDPKGDCVYD